MSVPDVDLRQAVVLVVDDEQPNVELLQACLADEGYERVHGTVDPRRVLGLFDSLRPDLVLLDLHMPWIDGFTLLEQLRERIHPEDYLPVLVLTADVTEATKKRALSGGARDFLTKPLDLTEVVLRIRNLLETRFLHQQQQVARRAAEESGRRSSWLASASEVLADSFDYHTTLCRLCRSLVPRFADYCVIDILQPDGGVARVGVAHVDHAKEQILRDSPYAGPGRLPPEHPIVTALQQGRRTLAQEITPEMAEAVTADEEHRKVIEQLAPCSLITVPLQASGRIHGALLAAQAESGRRFELPDLELAAEIAHRAALTIENAQLFNQAVQASRARDEMLAIVAHDLRNPLGTVKMGSDLLLETATSDSQRRYAELVSRAADRMNRLIEDLLDVTRIESGKLRIDPQEHTAASITAEAVALLAPLAESRMITLSAEVDRQLPPVMVDPTRILQVFSNLIGNALKFTPEGGRITLGSERVGQELRFVVADTGSGISPDQLPHVFGRLWQANDRDNRGVGLGLSIVRGIVEAHGGRVWAESELGKGTSFYFTLPLATGTSAEPVADPTRTAADAPTDDSPPIPTARIERGSRS